MTSERFCCSDAYEDTDATSTSHVCGEVGATNPRPYPRVSLKGSKDQTVAVPQRNPASPLILEEDWRQNGARQQQDRRQTEKMGDREAGHGRMPRHGGGSGDRK